MSQRSLIVAVLAAASILCGIVLALGMLKLASDSTRWLILFPFALAWVVWEPLMRLRARAYDGNASQQSRMERRAALLIAILIGLGVILVVSLGWLNV